MHPESSPLPPGLKVIIISNWGPDWTEYDYHMAQRVLDLLTDAFRARGITHEVVKFFASLEALDRYDPRRWVVWNWGEEMAGRPWSDAEVAEELERRGFVYTGSPPEVLRQARSRTWIKERVRRAGLLTLPSRLFADPAQAPEWQTYPAIVKGANQHASFGLARESVVDSPESLARRIVYLRQHFSDQALVEPFLDTREFHVPVTGSAQLAAWPPVEYDYAVFDDPRDRIYMLDWKFDPASRGYNEIRMISPAPADRPGLRARLEHIAVEACRAVGVRDYGRVDLRMLDDEPQVLDVNTNPDLDPTSAFPVSAQALGLDWGQMAYAILACAAARLPG